MKTLIPILLVLTLVCGCKVPNTGSINPTAPLLTSLAPPSALTGLPSLTLTAGGSNFVSGSTVRFNGVARPTIFMSPTRLQAKLTAQDLSVAASVPITVSDPDGTMSNAILFVVGNTPVPTITSIAPSSAPVGSGVLSLSVAGTNFTSGSKVHWNSQERPTTVVSVTQLVAAIPSTDLAAAGQALISVANPPPGGGSSNAVVFTITPSGPVVVRIENFAFAPADTTVAAGSSVEFTNLDQGVQHSVTKDVQVQPGPDMPLLNPGASYVFQVPPTAASGTTFFYHCRFHGTPGDGTTLGAGMAGVIRVR
jgi:plastocyanin